MVSFRSLSNPLCIILRAFLLCVYLSHSGVNAGQESLDSISEIPEIEVFRRKGVDALNAENYVDAEKAFYHVIELDYRSPEAHLAVKKLKAIQEKTGKIQAAVNEYKNLRASGSIPAASGYVPKYADLINQVNEPFGMEKHLSTLMKFGGLLAAQTSFLGIALNAFGYFEESNYYLAQADSWVKKAEEEIVAVVRARLGVRPLHYVYPSFYEKDRTPWLSVGQFQMILFEGQRTPYEVEPLAAEAIKKLHWTIRLAANATYNSNVRERSEMITPAYGINRTQAMVQNYLFYFGVQSDPTALFLWGADYTSFYRYLMREDVRNLSAWSHHPSAWLSWWNQREDEFRARIDFDYTRKEPAAFDREKIKMGPLLSWDHLWNERYQMQVIYSMMRNYDSDPSSEPNSSGTQHEGGLRFFYGTEKARVQPSITYDFNRDFTESSALNLIEHRVGLGTSFLMGKWSVLRLKPEFGYRIYPLHEQRRRDLVKSLAFHLGLPLSGDSWVVFSEARYDSVSSSLGDYSYSRWLIQLGLSTTFRF